MSKHHIIERLVQYGKELYKDEGSYTNNKDADRFVRKNSNAWLFGVIFDQGIPYERAWAAPFKMKQRLGHFSIKRIARRKLPNYGKQSRGIPREKPYTDTSRSYHCG